MAWATKPVIQRNGPRASALLFKRSGEIAECDIDLQGSSLNPAIEDIVSER